MIPRLLRATALGHHVMIFADVIEVAWESALLQPHPIYEVDKSTLSRLPLGLASCTSNHTPNVQWQQYGLTHP
jgi:hypothetical protein